MDELRRILALLLDGIDAAASGVASGRLNADQFQAEMVRRLFEGHVAAWLVGNDATTVSPGAQRIINDAVKAQIDYLNAFADEIAATGWQDKYAARARLYAGSIKPIYSIGRSFGLDLPYHPTQGSECMVNCGCWWRIDWLNQEELDADCTWIRGKDDSCPTCIARAGAGTLRIRGGERV